MWSILTGLAFKLSVLEGLSDIYQLSAYMLYQCLETDISGLKEVTEII